MRQVRYRQIADQLRASIVDGTRAAGSMLPSESELSAEHGVSRVTVRRALEVLREEGLVDARQGFGWFVAAPPVRQDLSRLDTIEDRLDAAGVESVRRIVEFGFVVADGRVAEVLGAGEVLRVRRLNLADGVPFARVTVWCPANLAAELSRADVERRPFVQLLGVDVGGATQVIGAAAAASDDAELLGVPPGSPVLRVERVTRDTSDAPILLAEHAIPAHRTEFVVELNEVRVRR